jgi:hypothetical protein
MKSAAISVGARLILDVNAGEIVEINPRGPPAAAAFAFGLQKNAIVTLLRPIDFRLRVRLGDKGLKVAGNILVVLPRKP